MCKWNVKALLDGTEGYDRKLDIKAVQRNICRAMMNLGVRKFMMD